MNRKRLLILIVATGLTVLGLLVTLLNREPRLYRVTTLPTLGGRFTLPYAINERGQVAGFSEVAKGSYHLFLWDRRNGMQDLGPVVNGDVDINDRGQIVGTMRDPNGHERAFIWDAEHGRYVLPTLGGETAIAHAINNLGQVVGEADTAGGIHHAFFWDPSSGVLDLTPASTQGTRAWSVNDAGETIIFATGGSTLVDVEQSAASPPRTIPLRGLIEVNSHGYVAGLAPAGPRRFDVAIWHSDAGLKTIVQLNSGSPASARMNDVGQVAFAEVGGSGRKRFGIQFPPRPDKNYLHDPNLGQLSLNGYVPAGSWENLWLTDLNNHGCIVGAVQSARESSSRGVLIEPIPERWGQ